MRKAHVEYNQVRASALLMQKIARKRKARKDFNAVLSAISTAQKMWRGKVGRREAKSLWDECTFATIMIQSKFRVKVARMRARKIRDAAVRIQSVQRGRLARRDWEEIRAGALRMLSDDLMEIVFSNLIAKDLGSARLVWKSWNKVAKSENLWQQLSTAHFGEDLACAASQADGWRAPCVSMGRLNQIRWMKPEGSQGALALPLPPMPCSRQGHTLTAVSATEAVLLFGKDGPGTQGEAAMDSGSHYMYALSTTGGGPGCQMGWDELKIDAAGDWRWQATETPPARWGHTATMIEPGLIAVFGGFGEDDVMDDVWLLQIGPTRKASEAAAVIDGVVQPTQLQGRWIKPEVKGAPPSARAFHSATMVSGVGVVVFGGLSAAGRAHRDTFVLTNLGKGNIQNSPWRVQWKKLGSCRWARAGHAAALHPKRGLFFVGGMTRTRDGKDVFRTDACMLRIGAWQRHGACLTWMYSEDGVNLPARRCTSHTMVGHRLLMYGGCEGQQSVGGLLEDKQRLCHDLLAVDLNVCFRLMHAEKTEEERQKAQAAATPEPEPGEVCLYHIVHMAGIDQGESVLECPDSDSEDEEGIEGEAAVHTLTHGGAGGVESAGFAQVGSYFVICGGTTQASYSTLSTMDTLSSVLLV